MGYTENEIFQALEMKNHDKKSKIYNPFSDTSEMIDKLTMVQKCNNAPESNDIPPKNLGNARRSTEDSDSSNSSAASCQENNYRKKENNNLSSLKFSPSWTCTTFSPRSVSVNRSASFTNAHGYGSLVRRPRSSYLLHSLGGSSTGLNNNSVNHSSVQRLIETFDNDRKALYEEFGKELAEMKMKLEKYAEDKRVADEKLLLIKNENDKIKSELKHKDLMEKKLNEIEKENEELKNAIRSKEDEVESYKKNLEDLYDISEKAERLNQSLKQKEQELLKKNSEIESLEKELKLLSNPEKAIRELEDELVQIKLENREFREKQAILSCTTCLDQPRNVLYMPCLHFICCSNCVANTDTCSICRTRIMGKVQVYQ